MQSRYGVLTFLYYYKDINKLEAVQEFALRMCSNDWEANYRDLLDDYQTPNLSARRQYLNDLSHLLKSCKVPNAPVSKYSNIYSTRSHLAQHYAPIDVVHCFFFPLSGTHYHCYILPHTVVMHLSSTTGPALVNNLFCISIVIFISWVHINISVAIILCASLSIFIYPVHSLMIMHKTIHFTHPLA